MKKIKKLLALAMAMCMIFSMTTVAFATDGTIDSPHIYQYRGAAVEITVPAESTVYYEISSTLASYIASGVIMEVTGDNNVVVYYGVRPQGMMPGQTAIEIPLDPSLMKFSLENSSESDITVYVDLVENQSSGTMDNPFVLEEADFVQAEVSANSDGYWITYEAPADGTLGVEVWAVDEDYNDLGWQFFVNNETSGRYGDRHASDDEEVVSYEELEVSAGDIITIMANTYNPENMWANPAGIVNVNVTFTAPEGSQDNPKWFDDIVNDITIPAGSEVFYTGRYAGTTLLITNANGISVEYNGDNYPAVNGVIEIEIPESDDYSSSDLFKFVNDGNTDADITVKIVYPEGDRNNPEIIEEGSFSKDFEAGNTGYYYQWIAPSDGTVTIGVSSEDGWKYQVTDIENGVYGTENWHNDDPVVPSETYEVSEGDVLTIMVATNDADVPWNNPAGTVTLTVAFEGNNDDNNNDNNNNNNNNNDNDNNNGAGTGDGTTDGGKTPTGDASMIGLMLVIAAASAVVVFKKRTVQE